MALAKKCDRCNNFYEPYDGYLMFQTSVKSNILSCINTGSYDRLYKNEETYELCPACMTEFAKFLGYDVELATPEIKDDT